jgi:hypothetical protein
VFNCLQIAIITEEERDAQARARAAQQQQQDQLTIAQHQNRFVLVLRAFESFKVALIYPLYAA